MNKWNFGRWSAFRIVEKWNLHQNNIDLKFNFKKVILWVHCNFYLVLIKIWQKIQAFAVWSTFLEFFIFLELWKFSILRQFSNFWNPLKKFQIGSEKVVVLLDDETSVLWFKTIPTFNLTSSDFNFETFRTPQTNRRSSNHRSWSSKNKFHQKFRG